MRTLLIITTVILSLSVYSSEKLDAIRIGQDYALFFAVKDYSGNPSFENLRNPINDAHAIAKELEEMYIFNTKVYENPSRNRIYEVLKQWRNRHFGTNDQLFVFFTGHGDFDEFVNKGYFIPAGSGQNRIDLTDLGNIITQIPCEHILLAIDACYSGTIDEAIAFKSRDWHRPGATETSEKDRLLNNWLRNKSRLLLTSGAKNCTPDGREHSPFANAFLKGLKAAYSSGDGLFSYQDILASMDRVSPKPHHGVLNGHDEGGFVFVVDGGGESEPIKLASHDGLVFVQGGTFQMGSNDGNSDEKPVHSVTVPSFYIGKYEVTQKQWRDVMGSDPSRKRAFS